MSQQHRTMHMTYLGVNLGALMLLLMCAMVFWLAIIRPQSAQRQHLADQSERIESVQRAASHTHVTESELRETLADIQQREADLRARIPAEADEHTFLHDVTQIAKNTGVQIVDYQRTGSADEPTHSTLRLDVRCRGDYAAMCRLIDQLNNFQRLVVVERLDVVSDLASAEHDFTIALVLIYDLKAEANPTGDVTDA